MAVAALGVIIAFAVPNLNTSFGESLIFSGSVAARLPWPAGHPVYFGNRDHEEANPFRPSTISTLVAPVLFGCDLGHHP